MNSYRIAIVGADTLLGKELGTVLNERHFPARSTALLQLPGAGAVAETQARSLTEFADEAMLLDPYRPEALAEADVVFFAEPPPAPVEFPGIAIHLTGDDETAPLTGFSAARHETKRAQVAHPAAQALGLIVPLLGRAGALEVASACVFEPASERGLAGIQELEQQTVRLLALQSQPQTVYDCQVAFNLRARLGEQAKPRLQDVRNQVERQSRRLLGSEAPPEMAVQLIQAPVFHSCGLALYVRYAAPAQLQLDNASEWINAGMGEPDLLDCAGQDAIQVGPPHPAGHRGFNLFLTLDNLRRRARSAVDAALAALVTVALVASLGLIGCGYHIAGHGGVIPAATTTVAVLPFANHTRQPQLSQAVSAAVAQEFARRTHYRVEPALTAADANGPVVALHGDVLSVELNPVTFDAASGRATTVEVVVHLKAWLETVAPPGGKPIELFRNNDMVFHDQYEISLQQQNFFEEDATAFARLSHSIAQTLVADIVEAF